MITILIRYQGKNGNARRFMQEMLASGLVEQIRSETGNLGYDYYLPIDDEETVLLVDSWVDQAALDHHHQLPLMQEIAKLREKYDLHMKVEKPAPANDEGDEQYLRR